MCICLITIAYNSLSRLLSRGEYVIKLSVAGFTMQNKIGPNRILGFVKMNSQKDLKSMKEGSIGLKITEKS